MTDTSPNRYLKMALIAALIACGLCLAVKSFVVIRYAPEQKGGAMTLMLKANPLKENLRFDDPAEARYFLHTHPEHYSGNSLPDYIFKVPLPVWLFLFLLLLAVLSKMRRPALKKRWLAAGVVLPPLLVCVTWLYGSHSPREKVYTADRRYYYYLEEYNYNDVMRKIFGSFIYRQTDYKVFIFDNRDERRIYAGSAGETQSWEGWFGFRDEFAQTRNGKRVWFYFNKFDYFELPGSQERQAEFLEHQRLRAVQDSIRQEEMRQRAVADSIRWERERAEARQRFVEWQAESPIPAEDVAYLEPVIRPWLEFYDIDLSGARYVGKGRGGCVNCPRNPEESGIYYHEFGTEEDSPSLVQMSYSPDRRRYVDMLIELEMRDGVWHDMGEYDIDQAVFLVDRRRRTKNLLVYNGSSDRVEDIFWKGNDVFVTVGFSSYDVVLFRIKVYDIPGGTQTTYEALFEGDMKTLDERGSYRDKVYLPSRGIVPYIYVPSEQ